MSHPPNPEAVPGSPSAVPRSPSAVPGPPDAPRRVAATDAGGGAGGGAVAAALAGLQTLDAIAVHDHVAVYAEVDRALRERLSATEG